MASRTLSEPLNYIQAVGLLEDVREGLNEHFVQLAYQEADTFLEGLEEAWDDDDDDKPAQPHVPPEVHALSRDAFAHSSKHGPSISGLGSKEHHIATQTKHTRAAALARKHGLTTRATVHDAAAKVAGNHAKAIK